MHEVHRRLPRRCDPGHSVGRFAARARLLIMYRQMAHAACASCGVAHPPEQMELRPDGNQWCWQCKVAAEIAVHRRWRLRSWQAIALIAGATAFALYVGYYVIVLMLFLRHPC